MELKEQLCPENRIERRMPFAVPKMPHMIFDSESRVKSGEFSVPNPFTKLTNLVRDGRCSSAERGAETGERESSVELYKTNKLLKLSRFANIEKKELE